MYKNEWGGGERVEMASVPFCMGGKVAFGVLCCFV
jgi:ribosomal protein L4